ncbi:MAG: hypothetical protein JRI25_21980, partial [Deltaproteobacteria bacterium]|nr:hypothetical protein [Deltaproteobacteria bacterium]
TLSDGRQQRTNAQGRFLFRNLPEGVFEVQVAGARGVPAVHMENGPRDVLDLRLLVTDPDAIERALSPGLEEEPGITVPRPPMIQETRPNGIGE